MFACILLSAALVPNVPIGSGLSDGVALVYESGGVAQAPWIYQSVRVMEREGFDRCVRIARQGQPARETCVREDTLFERSDTGEYRRTRPIGPGMRLDVVTASGQLMRYEIGSLASRRIAGAADVSFLPTTITTREKDGVMVRRLREEYAPALLTALRGEFDEPNGEGGWRTVREFSLSEIRPLHADRTTAGAPVGNAPVADSAITRESVESRGERRTYHLLEPPGREPAPLVLLLHGTGGTGRELVERWSRLAGRESLILAAPASSDAVGWRVPRDGPDLFRDVVDAVAGRRPVDRGRIYLVGYSAGGDAALYSSLAQSRYFAASAVLAAALRPRQYPLIDLADRRIPVALFSAALDAAYPLAEVRSTRDAFEARGFSIQYVELNGRDHAYIGASDDVIGRAWAFLQEHRLDGEPVYRALDARLASFALR